MYLVGEEHPNKRLAEAMIERLVRNGERLVTDAEVFQEILHRYTAVRRQELIEPAYAFMRKLIDEVFSVDMSAVELARSVVLSPANLSARDALHVATMKINGVSRIATFDKDYDRVAGISRLSA